jgi:hypothetical protein
LLAQKFDAATHVGEPADEFAAFRLRHALEKDPKRSPHRQIMLARKSGEFNGVSRQARDVAAHQANQSQMTFAVRARADVRVVRALR